MVNIVINNAGVENLFYSLHQQLGGSISKDHRELRLDFDHNGMNGYVRGIIGEGGLSFFDFNFTSSQPISIGDLLTRDNVIYFLYSLKGEIVYSAENEASRIIEPYQTTILSSKKCTSHKIELNTPGAFRYTLIVADVSGADPLNSEMRDLFLPGVQESNYLYIGSYNVKIAEAIGRLQEVTTSGMVRDLMTEGIIRVILAMELEQHSEDLNHAEKRNSSLLTKELDILRNISRQIKESPEKPYSIKFICEGTGLSPAKLQHGFKLLHDRTVTEYIRGIRLESAEYLIKTSDLNISEIVYSVGFTSRSYFSKIFKEKYNCSPKQYQENQSFLAITA
ncbi:helix-turn-helix domain-containing protein [Robertkochia solimangrovi]|uniref:helix-turn-helix domain-containing protein n=1 Tax=Robertkochia solimangrovi TaxID=2213046 RepID=UPI00117E5DE9|nr:AraC family transcriptional regulator [Robertkochia solimangrovi]TRZ42931.1 AraC family transcriptional regulator [Robertkochia solimangrovi]